MTLVLPKLRFLATLPSFTCRMKPAVIHMWRQYDITVTGLTIRHIGESHRSGATFRTVLCKVFGREHIYGFGGSKIKPKGHLFEVRFAFVWLYSNTERMHLLPPVIVNKIVAFDVTWKRLPLLLTEYVCLSESDFFVVVHQFKA